MKCVQKNNTLMSMQWHQNWLSDVLRWHREDQIMSTKWKGHQKCGPKRSPNMVQKGDPNLEWSKEWSKTWSKTWSKRGFKEWSNNMSKRWSKRGFKEWSKMWSKGWSKRGSKGWWQQTYQDASALFPHAHMPKRSIHMPLTRFLVSLFSFVSECLIK